MGISLLLSDRVSRSCVASQHTDSTPGESVEVGPIAERNKAVCIGVTSLPSPSIEVSIPCDFSGYYLATFMSSFLRSFNFFRSAFLCSRLRGFQDSWCPAPISRFSHTCIRRVTGFPFIHFSWQG